MNTELDQRRGEEAARVLNSDIYKEAYQVIEDRLIGQLAVVEITKERAEYLRQLLVAGRKVKAYMEQVLLTGQYADLEEQKKLTLLERARERVRTMF